MKYTLNEKKWPTNRLNKCTIVYTRFLIRIPAYWRFAYTAIHRFGRLIYVSFSIFGVFAIYCVYNFKAFKCVGVTDLCTCKRRQLNRYFRWLFSSPNLREFNLNFKAYVFLSVCDLKLFNFIRVKHKLRLICVYWSWWHLMSAAEQLLKRL